MGTHVVRLLGQGSWALPSAAGSLPPMVGLGAHSGQSVPVLRPVKETHVDVDQGRAGRGFSRQKAPGEDGDLQLPQTHFSAKTTPALSERGCWARRYQLPQLLLPSPRLYGHLSPFRYRSWGVALQNLPLEFPEHLPSQAAGHGVRAGIWRPCPATY